MRNREKKAALYAVYNLPLEADDLTVICDRMASYNVISLRKLTAPQLRKLASDLKKMKGWQS